MQFAFVLAKGHQEAGASSPRGSQWSFSSVDLEFRLFDLRQKTWKDIIFLHVLLPWSRFWSLFLSRSRSLNLVSD